MEAVLPLPASRYKWLVLLCILALFCAALASPAGGDIFATLPLVFLWIALLIPLAASTHVPFCPARRVVCLPIHSPRPPPIQ